MFRPSPADGTFAHTFAHKGSRVIAALQNTVEGEGGNPFRKTGTFLLSFIFLTFCVPSFLPYFRRLPPSPSFVSSLICFLPSFRPCHTPLIPSFLQGTYKMIDPSNKLGQCELVPANTVLSKAVVELFSDGTVKLPDQSEETLWLDPDYEE
jgi:hypothetical protein